MQGWEWIVIIFIVILVIAAIVWAIWFFGVRDIGNPAGSSCGADKDCAKKTFCNASGKCQSGTGKKLGETCSTNNECLIGLECRGGTCQAAKRPGMPTTF